MKKTILCYGDSNTWGYVPGSGERFPFEDRWTTILEKKLGKDFRVIAEGLNGRTTVFEEPYRPNRNGEKMIYPLLESHSPFDLLIIMLGTNDLKHYYCLNATDIAKGISTVLKTVKIFISASLLNRIEVLLISPPIVIEIPDTLGPLFKGAYEKSLLLSSFYKNVSEEFECHFIDSAKYIMHSDIDGVHIDKKGHHILAKIISDAVVKILK